MASGCVATDDEVGTTEEARLTSLTPDRDRLLDTMPGGRCGAWYGMSPSARGVFLTTTDLLGKRSFLRNPLYTYYKSYDDGCSPPGDCTNGCMTRNPSGFCVWVSGNDCLQNNQCGRSELPRINDYELETALPHVTRVWAVNGQGGFGCVPFPPICCSDNGGGDANRIFFSADDLLIGNIRNFDWGLPMWRFSTDPNQHAPFNNSSETEHGQPRGQVQFWRYDWDAQVLMRPGVYGVYDPKIVELDLDYNTCHDSNPDGYYGGLQGRQLYESMWWWQGLGGSAELGYWPTGC